MTMFRRLCAGALALAAAWLLPCDARASQGSGCLPTTGIFSGLVENQDANAAFAALISSNSGASAPVTDCSAAAVLGQFWLDTSTNPYRLRYYDGTGANWLNVGWLDPTNHVWTPVVGGGSDTVNSGATTDLCSKNPAYLSIAGTTTITSFSNTCAVGQIKVLSFANANLTIIYNATSLILPTAASIVTQALDKAAFVYLGGGNWACIGYMRADGTALSSNTVFAGAVFLNGVITPTALAANTNNWNPAGLATANMIRASSSANVKLTGLTAPATNGQRIVLSNVNAIGGNTITLTTNDGNSAGANRFILPYPVELAPGQSIALVYDNVSASWRAENPARPAGVMAAAKNLSLGNVSTIQFNAPGTPNNQVTIAADEIILEDSQGGTVRITGLLCTPDITLSGAGGLDTSTVASNTWYSIWVIFNQSTQVTSCLFSASSTSPTLPSGYGFRARVGWDFTDGSSHLERIIQNGDRVKYANANTIAAIQGTAGNVTTPTWSAVADNTNGIKNWVPPTAVAVDVYLCNGSAGVAMAAENNSYGSYGTTVVPYAPPLVAGDAGGANSTHCMRGELTLEIFSPPRLYYASSSSGAGLYIYGWKDNR